jgi:hypothetical protein
MTAPEASNLTGAVLDREGTIWVRVGDMWDYVSGTIGLTGWDYKAKLPTAFAPYSSFDNASRRFILRSVKVGELK